MLATQEDRPGGELLSISIPQRSKPRYRLQLAGNNRSSQPTQNVTATCRQSAALRSLPSPHHNPIPSLCIPSGCCKLTKYRKGTTGGRNKQGHILVRIVH
jgi:hypothetical protein